MKKILLWIFVCLFIISGLVGGFEIATAFFQGDAIPKGKPTGTIGALLLGTVGFLWLIRRHIRQTPKNDTEVTFVQGAHKDAPPAKPEKSLEEKEKESGPKPKRKRRTALEMKAAGEREKAMYALEVAALYDLGKEKEFYSCLEKYGFNPRVYEERQKKTLMSNECGKLA